MQTPTSLGGMAVALGWEDSTLESDMAAANRLFNGDHQHSPQRVGGTETQLEWLPLQGSTDVLSDEWAHSWGETTSLPTTESSVAMEGVAPISTRSWPCV